MKEKTIKAGDAILGGGAIVLDGPTANEGVRHNPIMLYAEQKQPYCCPVCNGQKTVSKPPHIDGDVHEWSDNRTGGYPCKACNATGIVWG